MINIMLNIVGLCFVIILLTATTGCVEDELKDQVQDVTEGMADLSCDAIQIGAISPEELEQANQACVLGIHAIYSVNNTNYVLCNEGMMHELNPNRSSDDP